MSLNALVEKFKDSIITEQNDEIKEETKAFTY